MGFGAVGEGLGGGGDAVEAFVDAVGIGHLCFERGDAGFGPGAELSEFVAEFEGELLFAAFEVAVE